MRASLIARSLAIRAFSTAFAGEDLRLLGLGVAGGALACHLGALHGALHLDLALLLEPRRLAVALDVERLPLGLEVARADADHRFLLDVVPDLPLLLDLLDDARQTLGIEAVRRVEILQVGLVEVGDRHGFEQQAVLVQRLGRRLLDPLHIDAALLVHFLHRHLGGDGAQRRDELAGEQRIQFAHLQRAATERGGGDRDSRPIRLHPHVEFGVDVDAHPVPRDQRILAGAGHREPEHVHIHRRHVMDEGQHEGAAVDHHLLAHQARAHEGDFLRGSPIEPVHEIDDDRDHDHRHDEPQDQVADELPGHALTPPRRPIFVMRRAPASAP